MYVCMFIHREIYLSRTGARHLRVADLSRSGTPAFTLALTATRRQASVCQAKSQK